MKLKQNILMTAEEKSALADEAIERLEEIIDQKRPYLIAQFGSASVVSTRRSIHDKYWEIPKDIVPCVIAKFKAKGWFVFFNGDFYEIHSRELGYKGEYV